ncbi:hypothetical protein XENTR_v10013768 [Xenopus tropicalis]|nr:hypothetical protein XENTR_v10013768 [Xenopus tropicalis]
MSIKFFWHLTSPIQSAADFLLHILYIHDLRQFESNSSAPGTLIEFVTRLSSPTPVALVLQSSVMCAFV